VIAVDGLPVSSSQMRERGNSDIATRKCMCNLVMLRMPFHYVSKPAIFKVCDDRKPSEIKVPIEFQGLGAAARRRFPQRIRQA
jgi:hypothetical protein